MRTLDVIHRVQPSVLVVDGKASSGVLIFWSVFLLQYHEPDAYILTLERDND